MNPRAIFSIVMMIILIIIALILTILRSQLGLEAHNIVFIILAFILISTPMLIIFGRDYTEGAGFSYNSGVYGRITLVFISGLIGLVLAFSSFTKASDCPDKEDSDEDKDDKHRSNLWWGTMLGIASFIFFILAGFFAAYPVKRTPTIPYRQPESSFVTPTPAPAPAPAPANPTVMLSFGGVQ